MATDLVPRKTSKAATYLERKFADLCARIRRVDLIAHLLTLALVTLTYACVVGTFDWYVGATTSTWVTATRALAFLAFALLFGFGAVQTIRLMSRRVNPYFVAREIEQSLPDAKNSLINWLDLCDEDIPSAFQKNLSVKAHEQMDAADAEQTIRSRKNRLLAGALAVPTLVLLVLLVFSPSALAASLLRAFLPFYSPAVVAQTRITLVQPAGGDAEVSADQAIAFVVRIEGRVPAANRPGAPMLHYRHQKSEEFRALALHADDGDWTATLSPSEIRTGFTYKICAGDAATPEHEIRVRGAAHVRQYEIAYHHKPYRRLRNTVEIFPNRDQDKPSIAGPPGSEVEVTVHTSRPVQSGRVELSLGQIQRELPGRMIDRQTFACKWPLEQSGQFRVHFTTPDGEDNLDRAWHPIQVTPDDAPTVVLTQPGQDVTLAQNGTLSLEGSARSLVGLKALSLQLIVVAGPDVGLKLAKPYPLPSADFPTEHAYADYVGMDDFKKNGEAHALAAGTVIEYWLEAVDCTDTPDPQGRVGRSTSFKITLAAPHEPGKAAAQRQDAQKKKDQHEKKQSEIAKKKQGQKGAAGGASDPQQDLNNAKNENQGIDNKLKQAEQEKKDNELRGAGKGAEQPNADKKDGPQQGGDGGAQEKNQPPMTGDNAGANKDQGRGAGGEARDSGAKQPDTKNDVSKGEPKGPPKETSSPARDAGNNPKPEPASGVKDGGDMGSNAPMPAPPKDQMTDANAPMATAKGDKKSDDRPHGPSNGNAKGIEQNGPDTANKDGPGAANSPDVPTKAGEMMDNAGTAKDQPDPGNAGHARSDETKAGKQETSWPDFAKLHDQISDGKDEDAKAAAGKVADIAKNSTDARKRDLAKEILAKNERDPKTGEKTKGPNLGGSGGPKKDDLPRDVKIAVANREFAAKIGQLQLDDWRKRLTPDLLKRAGLSDEDWQRYIKNAQAYDALVRQLNAQQIRNAQITAMRGKGGATPNTGARPVEGAGTPGDALGPGRSSSPPEVLPALPRFQSLIEPSKAEKSGVKNGK